MIVLNARKLQVLLGALNCALTTSRGEWAKHSDVDLGVGELAKLRTHIITAISYTQQAEADAEVIDDVIVLWDSILEFYFENDKEWPSFLPSREGVGEKRQWVADNYKQFTADAAEWAKELGLWDVEAFDIGIMPQYVAHRHQPFEYYVLEEQGMDKQDTCLWMGRTLVDAEIQLNYYVGRGHKAWLVRKDDHSCWRKE